MEYPKHGLSKKAEMAVHKQVAESMKKKTDAKPRPRCEGAEIKRGTDLEPILHLYKDTKPYAAVPFEVAAAAPDLLAALKAIMEWDEVNTSIAINTEGCKAMRDAILAIQKAEGR